MDVVLCPLMEVSVGSFHSRKLRKTFAVIFPSSFGPGRNVVDLQPLNTKKHGNCLSDGIS